MYIRRLIPEHVRDHRAPVEKSRVLIPGITGQIPELLRIAVKLHTVKRQKIGGVLISWISWLALTHEINTP